MRLHVQAHERLPSTQDLARELVEAAPADPDLHGLVIRARAQTSARGRRARDWSAGAGGSWQTLIVREAALPDAVRGAPTAAPAPSPDAGAPPVLPPGLAVALGVALAETFPTYAARPGVKWPNDLALAGRKLGGILVERAHAHLLIGVGVNVANEPPPGASALRGWDPDGVSMIVLEGLQRGLELGLRDLRSRFARVDLLAGAAVRARRGAALVEGRADGVDALGRLRVRVGPNRVALLEDHRLEPVALRTRVPG